MSPVPLKFLAVTVGVVLVVVGIAVDKWKVAVVGNAVIGAAILFS